MRSDRRKVVTRTCRYPGVKTNTFVAPPDVVTFFVLSEMMESASKQQDILGIIAKVEKDSHKKEREQQFNVPPP